MSVCILMFGCDVYLHCMYEFLLQFSYWDFFLIETFILTGQSHADFELDLMFLLYSEHQEYTAGHTKRIESGIRVEAWLWEVENGGQLWFNEYRHWRRLATRDRVLWIVEAYHSALVKWRLDCSDLEGHAGMESTCTQHKAGQREGSLPMNVLLWCQML